MDSQTAFINAGISAGMYILYKIAQRYYVRSGCHNKTLEITIVDKEEKKEEIELTTIATATIEEKKEEKKESL